MKKNRIFISMQESLPEPDWFYNVEPFIQKVLTSIKIYSEEISFLFCNDSYIQQLNKNYRNIDTPTDVLSFENNDVYKDEEGKWKCAGDVVISLDTLPVNSDYFEEDMNSELKRLIVHGILHINGYDHGQEHIEKGVFPKCKMLKLQEKLLIKLKDEKIIK